MKPRVFVSSTFYDLKYIREDLANFIRMHDFEPIMFEEGDIGYTPGNALDDSCYEAMRNSDMAILIIGGQYGSAATGEDEKSESFASITRNEFRKAIEENVPVFCFIDFSVQVEYEIYKLNKEKLNENKESIQFRTVKNINVFKFIEEIYEIGNIPINSFEKSDDIKSFISKQWSDMFKKYLKILKEEPINKTINANLDNMTLILNQMQDMINKIGEETIVNKEEYITLINKQDISTVKEVAKNISNSIAIIIDDDEEEGKKILDNKEDAIDKLLKVLDKCYDSAFEKEKVNLSFLFSSNGLFFNRLMINNNVFLDNNLIPKVLQNKKLRSFLTSLLMEDEYFNLIFNIDYTTELNS